MKVNEGTLDRSIRIVLGAAAWLAAALIGTNPWMIILALAGLILLVTGAFGVCPLYRFARIKTTKAATATTTEGAATQDESQRKHAA